MGINEGRHSKLDYILPILSEIKNGRHTKTRIDDIEIPEERFKHIIVNIIDALPSSKIKDVALH